MKYQKIIGALFTLGLITFAAAGDFSVASVANIQTIIIGSDHTGNHHNDAASFLPVVTDAVSDSSVDQRYHDTDSGYRRYVGLGFDLSSGNGNPRTGNCDGNNYCGEPNPSD